MSDGDTTDGGFEEKLRSIAREVNRSVERMTEFDLEVAQAIGLDRARANELADFARRWLRGQAKNLDDAPFWEALSGRAVARDPRRSAGPHPLDLPTEEQGLALSALASGRWTVEPGSNVVMTNGEGAGPTDGSEVVSELRARDWIAANGEVTRAGSNALARWLDSVSPR